MDMRKLNCNHIVISAAVTLAACGPQAPETSSDADEIYAGWIDSTNTSVGHLRIIPSLGTTTTCTAVLVGPRTAITAAHCMTSNFYNEVRFTTGGYHYGPATDTYQVTNYVVHPSYDENTFANDIAVLHFSQDVTGITPSPVATYDFAGPYPLGVEVSGFGWWYSSGPYIYQSGRRRASTYVTSINGQFLRIPANAGGTACEGDSGGPAFVGGTVWGIVSHGTDEGCNYDTVAQYLRVTEDIALFIHQNRNGLVYFNGFTNPVQPEDVNGDGVVSPSDALAVINAVAAGVTLTLPNTKQKFHDVNGDGNVTTTDALIIINYLGG